MLENRVALSETMGEEFVNEYGQMMMDPSSWGGGVEVGHVPFIHSFRSRAKRRRRNDHATHSSSYQCRRSRHPRTRATPAPAVQIDVFSQLHKCTIHVFNVAQMEEEIFGRGRGNCMCFLLYDATSHYDIISWAPPSAKKRGGGR